MKNLIYLFILIVFLFTACGKKEEAKKDDRGAQEKKEMTVQQKKDDSLKAVSEQIDKEKKVKAALEEQKILNDSLGQWVTGAEASSTYQDHKGTEGWSAEQMIGKPDVEAYGDNQKAWTPKDSQMGLEWVKLTYEKAVNATEIKIRQTYNPGSIIQVELIDVKGKNHTVWEGIDKTKYEQNTIQYFNVKFDKTDYMTKTVKITLATNTFPGWKEIDAVQLIGN
jgi:ribosomal protein L31